VTRNVPAALQTDLDSGVVPLATCVKLTLTDTTVIGFTDWPEDLLVSAVTYKSIGGYTPSSVKSTSELNVDNVEIVGYFEANGVTLADVRAGILDGATFEKFKVNPRDTSKGVINLRYGTLGRASSGDLEYSFEGRGLFQRLQQPVGKVVTSTCRAELFDTQCGVNPATFTVTSTITGVTSRAKFQDTTRTEADDWFNNGVITFTSGNNNGISREVKDYTLSSGEVETFLPFPYDVAASDGYSMVAGCDKSKSTCISKFSNITRRRAEDFVPGSDKANEVPKVR